MQKNKGGNAIDATKAHAIAFRVVKILDIGYVTAIYFVLALCVSLFTACAVHVRWRLYRAHALAAEGSQAA